MYFRFTPFNSATLSIILLTAAMIWARFRFDHEKTWLLLYYVAIVAYWLSFWDSLNPWCVGAGVACGALLRFEFMGGWVLKGVRGLELVFFGYVIWRGGALLLLWPG